MSNNTIKQHYVWREYLRSFCYEKDRIYSLINRSKIVPNNLTNVAQERYFYKLHEIDEKEFVYLNGLLNYFIKENNELKEYLQTVLLSFIPTILKKSLKNDAVKKEFEKNIQNDYFERHMTRSESHGKSLISANSLKEIKKCFSTENRFKTILFLSIQLVRTKKQKKKLLNIFLDHEIDFEKIWFYISFMIGNILAWNVIQVRKLKVSYIKNKSSLDFITTDQPIINLEREVDQDGSAKYFKLYFALNPKSSIILDFEAKEDLFEELNIDEEDFIKKLNNELIIESHMFIFSQEKENLDFYINSK